jgi:hypothetical protein
MRRFVRAILPVLAIILSLWIGASIGRTAPLPTTSPLLSPLIYVPLVLNNSDGTAPDIGYKGVGVIWQKPFECSDLEPFKGSIKHLQNWKPDPPSCPGVVPVCMWWGLGQIGAEVNPDCTVILLWNEPQIPAQSDIDPFEGATHWPDVEAAVGSREFSTPCADHTWLTIWANAFYASHNRWPDFDYVCVHSYPYILPGMTVQDAINQTISVVEDAQDWSLSHGGDGRVWLHEFGLWPAWCPGEDCVEEYISGIVPWLESEGVWYDWFALEHVDDYMAPPYDTSLVKDGQLTKYGTVY